VVDANFRNNIARLAFAHKLVTDLYSSHFERLLFAAGDCPN